MLLFCRGGIYLSGALAAVERYAGDMNVSTTRRLFTRIRQFTGDFVGRGLAPSRALVSASELHGAVKTAPYKAVSYSILSKSGIKISMF